MTSGRASLVIQTSHLGDTVLTTPLIRRLGMQGAVDVVATPASAALLSGNPYIRDVVVFDKAGKGGRVRGMFQTAKRLRNEGADGQGYVAAFMAQGSVRSALLAILAGVKTRVGFETSTGAFLYTRRLRYHEGLHHTQRLWLLAGPGELADLRPELFPSTSDFAFADELIGDDPDPPVVVLAPGSKRTTKRWPHFAELARLIGASARVVTVGGSDDCATAAEISCARGANRTLDAVPAGSLLMTAALIARADVVVCNDSMALHMAAAFDVPVVAVFGPTAPGAGFAPLSRTAITVEPEPLECRPCAPRAPHACPRKHWRCMRDTPASLVAAHVSRLLGGHFVTPGEA